MVSRFQQRILRGTNFYLVMAVLFGSTSTVFGTSEAGDPDPRAGRQASMDFSHLDEQTSANTIRYAPVTPAATRGPVAPAMQQPQGVLSGKIVFTSPGHGWQYSSALGRWATDRGTVNNIVEDLGNLDQYNYYVQYLFNAGATVVPFRPVGNQTKEVVMDNGDAGVTWQGVWTQTAGGTYFGKTTDAVGFQFATAGSAETAVATYRPNIPQRGFYPVYAWALNGNNRSADQLYRINHTGGASEVRVDHQRVGRGWVYLGSYYFEAGTNGTVQISNQSNRSPAAGVVIADAIRFGNGMGDVVDGGSISNYPREDEACMYWIQRMAGVNGDSATYSNNVNAPPRMAAHMNNSAIGLATERLYMGIHSNSSNGSGRGARGLYNKNASARTTFQEALAETIGAEVNNDMRAMNSRIPADWYPTVGINKFKRTDYDFGELQQASINNEMDATIIETAFHDNVPDAQIMRDPNSRKYIARAVLHGTVKYFLERGTGVAAYLPDEPQNIKVVSNGDGTATVSWTAPSPDPTGVQPPTSYVVYRSTDGYGFGQPTVVSTTQAVIAGVPADTVTYFRVAARNAGGESFPTETVAVRPSATGGKVLVVNAFDRLQESQNIVEFRSYIGNHHRIKPWKQNNYDYVVPHAKALHAAGYGFDSTSNEAVTAGLLSNYGVLVWAAGEESTADSTFSAAEQILVQNFLALGKGVFVSGSEIGWDLQQSGGGQPFYNNYLLTNYVTDSAGTYNVSAGAGLLAGVPALSFAPATNVHDTSYPPLNGGFYAAEYPDVINPINGSARVMAYGTGTGAAVAGSRNGYRVISFGFPFENIINENARNQVISKSMDFLMAENSNVSDWAIY